MKKKVITINRDFFEKILVENARLKIEIAELKKNKTKTESPMEKQISIEEYTKSLKPKGNKNE